MKESEALLGKFARGELDYTPEEKEEANKRVKKLLKALYERYKESKNKGYEFIKRIKKK